MLKKQFTIHNSQFSILALLFVIFLFVVPSSVFAQSYKTVPGFDTTKPILTYHISKEQITLNNYPFNPNNYTSLSIRSGSFKEDVTLYVYKGNFDALRGNKSNYSPISAFWLVFYNSKKEEVFPSKIIDVFAYNNFAGTDADFRAIRRSDFTQDPNQKLTFKNQANVRAIIPQNDGGFVISINKNIDKNNGGITFATPTPVSAAIPPFKEGVVTQNLPSIILIILLIVVGIIFGISLLKYLKRTQI